MAEQQALTPAFQVVGPRVEFGTVHIDHDDATRFRQIALNGTTIRDLNITDTSTYIYMTSYATGVLSDAKGDYAVSDSGFYAKTVAWAQPDYWRSTITFSRFNQKYADQKIYNVFEVESHAGELVSAVRKVRVIRNLTRLAFDPQTGEPIEETYSRQRKAFERPLSPEDIDAIATRATQIVSRQRVLGKRRI